MRWRAGTPKTIMTIKQMIKTRKNLAKHKLKTVLMQLDIYCKKEFCEVKSLHSYVINYVKAFVLLKMISTS